MNVPRGTAYRLRLLTDLVGLEAQRQNLIAPSTMVNFYRRHIADALQLVALLKDGLTVDVGSGGGFPGMVIACAREVPIILVEPRRLRAEFLERVRLELDLAHVTVRQSRIETIYDITARTVTARAVMPLSKLFAAAAGTADRETRWVLPKGRSAESELEAARQSWQGEFRLVKSRTDQDSLIVIAENVRRRVG